MLCSPLLLSHPHTLEYSFSQVASPHSFVTSLHTPICYCKSPPFLPFLTNTCYNPSLPTPCYQPTSFLLRSSSSNLGVLHILRALRFLLGSSFPRRLRYMSCQCSLLQLFPVSCFFYCLSPCYPWSHGYQHTPSPLLISVPCLQNLACGR